jgi:hypothetical protein
LRRKKVYNFILKLLPATGLDALPDGRNLLFASKTGLKIPENENG